MVGLGVGRGEGSWEGSQANVIAQVEKGGEGNVNRDTRLIYFPVYTNLYLHISQMDADTQALMYRGRKFIQGKTSLN